MPEPEHEQPEEFGVRLRWPSEEGGPGQSELGPGQERARPPTRRPTGSDGPPPEGRNLPATLPVVAGRLETVHAGIATLSMRIDALAGATNALRSQLTDRVTEYAETLARLGQSQATDLEDYRHTTERIASELRRSLTEQESALQRAAGRVEEMAADLAGLQESFRSREAENRAIVAGGETLQQSVSEGLDTFGSRVLDQLESGAEAAREGIAVVRAEVAGLRRDLAELRRSRVDVNLLAEIRSEVELLNETIGQGADPSEHLADLTAEVRAARDEQAEAQAALPESVRPVVAEATANLESEVEQLRNDLQGLVGGDTGAMQVTVDPEAVGAEMRAAMAAEFEPLRDELTSLRRRLGVRAKAVGFTDEQLAQVADAVAARLAPSALELSPEQLAALADLVVAGLERSFEVVDGQDEG